jgi:D-alanyl-D-alanine carboxypeptidase
MPENRRIHKHPLGGIVLASIVLLLIAAISLTITLTALSKGKDDKKDDEKVENSDNDKNDQSTDKNNNSSNKDENQNGSVKIEKVEVESSQSNFGPLIQLDDLHLYKRPIEELISRVEMSNLSAGVLLRDYNFEKITGNGNFIAKDNRLFLEKSVAAAFYEMIDVYVSETGHSNIFLRNAYYYDKTEDDKNTPDVNEALLNPHAFGMAIDILIQTPSGGQLPLKNSFSGYPKAEYYDWFIDNCHKFGFIHTGDSNEYSSFRYIGVPHSTYIYQKNITFDKYLSEIREFDYNNKKPITANGTSWWVYYVKAEDTDTTLVPVIGTKYSISGDNAGGFIVTVDQSGIKSSK